MDKSIAVYTRTYVGDMEFLPYLYRSLTKYFPAFSEAVLVAEVEELEQIRRYVPNFVKLVAEPKFAPGTIQHKYSKLTADLHTTSDYVMHVDSDTIFVNHVTEDSLFSYSGRPFLEFASYSHLHDYENSASFRSLMKKYFMDNVLMSELTKRHKEQGLSDSAIEFWFRDNYEEWKLANFESWFAGVFEIWKKRFGLCVWEQGTSFAVGEMVSKEYSRRPEKLYPREVYGIARDHIERTHEKDFKEFISTRIGKQSPTAQPADYFSDLNYIGAILDKYLHVRMEWVDIQFTNLFHRPPFLKQFVSYDVIKNGKITEAVLREIESHLI